MFKTIIEEIRNDPILKKSEYYNIEMEILVNVVTLWVNLIKTNKYNEYTKININHCGKNIIKLINVR